ncbi:MAG: FAD-dependent oxidoreductase [Alphaproteobacteria bacterium GM202ARS2]|nr:FAD-dependent oxidoreductase [Alphaproteobacteria bacterium GM202ARS2]
MQRIAIIGSGISGLTAAYLLARHASVTLYEKNPTLGGHTRTIRITPIHATRPIAVDTGFIVFNDKNYPLFTRLLRHLGIAREKSNMSFAVATDDGWLEYNTYTLRTLFAQPFNVIRPAYLMMLKDILRFFRDAPNFMAQPPSLSLQQYLDHLKPTPWFTRYFLLPMASAIWSCPDATVRQFPAATLIRFFHNHGLLSIADQPQWYTLTGGAQTYIDAITKASPFTIRHHQAVRVTRHKDNVTITDSAHQQQTYNQAILACHSDEALSLLDAPTPQEQRLLSAFRYQPNTIAVHSDVSFMPKRQRAWGSWTVMLARKKRPISAPAYVNYWMNNLQNIDKKTPIFVTLNPPHKPQHCYDEHTFSHPIFDTPAISAQHDLDAIQGNKRTWFCGAYQRYGFHEDGVWSACNIVKRFMPLPSWLT